VSEVSLAVEPREGVGKGVARKLRAAGRIPAIVYGQGKEGVKVSLDPTLLERLLQVSHAGMNTLIDLEAQGELAGRTVIVKELQRDPVYGGATHADFYEVNIDERIRVAVPIHLTGNAVGVTMGGLVDHGLREIELDCLPRAIPDEILVDVSHLEQGMSIHVGELDLPPDVECHTPAEVSVVSVVAPKAEEEPEVAELEEGELVEGEEPSEDAAEGDAAPAREERESSD
jgi:large subunit ribosomal protein L25